MAYTPEIERDVEEAKRKGWQGHLGQIEERGRAIESPWEVGKPTQRRLEAEALERHRQEQMELERQKLAQQMAIAQMNARAARSSGGGSGTAPGGNALVDTQSYVLGLIQSNPGMTLQNVKDSIRSQQPTLTQAGINMKEIDDFIERQYYNFHYNQALQARQTGERWDYGHDLRGMTDLRDQHFNTQTSPGISSSEAQKLSAMSGGLLTTSQIEQAFRLGQGDEIMKQIYGRQMR